jgi:hypothetical protein
MACLFREQPGRGQRGDVTADPDRDGSYLDGSQAFGVPEVLCRPSRSGFNSVVCGMDRWRCHRPGHKREAVRNTSHGSLPEAQEHQQLGLGHAPTRLPAITSPSRIRAARRHGSTQNTPRKQRSLDSERGLATPSPDGKGEISLGPSQTIMPPDPYSTLGRSCEPAYQVESPTGAARRRHAPAGGWSAPGGHERELLGHLAGKLTRGPAR